MERKGRQRGTALLAVVSALGLVLVGAVPARAAERLPRGATVRAVVVTDDAGEASRVARALTSFEGRGLSVVTARPTGRTVTVDLPVASPGLVAAVEGLADVAAVVPETTYTLFDLPDDPLYGDQGTSLRALRLPQAWDVSHGSGSVVVAVIDSGVTVDHPDLGGKIAGQHNAVTGSTSVTDQVGHGTMVASIAAASTDNTTGMAGSGWDTSILAVKVADSNGEITNAALADGIDWAVGHGADVINLSLGSETDDTAVRGAVADAVAADVVVVAAAGNSGVTTKFYPAALPNVLAVGATTVGGGSRASFSQYGSWVDVGAPGVKIIGANKSYATAADYVIGEGTSFASPLVAGVAALVRASRPGLTQDKVRLAITATSTPHSYGFAAGLVNAYAALGHELVLPGPTVSQPAPGATVSGSVPVVVAAGAVDASDVRARLRSGGPTVTAALVGGAATLQLPTDGSAGAETLSVVLCRQTLCSSSGTDLALTVDNPAPVITAPSDGTRAASGFTLTADSTSPAVRFVADGATTLGTDTVAPFSLDVAVTKLSPGPHVLTALSCDAAGTTCASDRPSAPVALTVARLSPSIVSLTPNPFSPDADGRKDTTTLTYSVDVKSAVSLTVKRSNGSVVTTKNAGPLSAGTHTWLWNGRDASGGLVASGTYSLVVDTSATVANEVLVGQVVRSLVVDKVNPSLTSRATSYPTVYPVKDGYRDATSLSLAVSEKTASLVARVYDAKGRSVWSSTRTGAAAGTARFTFTGRSTSGNRLPAGRYTFGFRATDPAGNVTTSPRTTVKVSAKKLSSARTATRTLTGERTTDGWGAPNGDGCSTLYRSGWAPGALYWESCSGGYVVSLHHLSIPKAVAYGTVRVSTYARGSAGSRATLLYLDDGDDVVAESHFDSDTRTHRGSAVRLNAALLAGQKVRWGMVVEDGDRYWAKTFTVTWTYYALV
ncbi:MAG TPA: S8 family serine peptidase [Candidatus Limnocylindria bacterium]|nr:S8 family serine peptidase [Candidatus Limnocylindria bacterium]